MSRLRCGGAGLARRPPAPSAGGRPATTVMLVVGLSRGMGPPHPTTTNGVVVGTPAPPSERHPTSRQRRPYGDSTTTTGSQGPGGTTVTTSPPTTATPSGPRRQAGDFTGTLTVSADDRAGRRGVASRSTCGSTTPRATRSTVMQNAHADDGCAVLRTADEPEPDRAGALIGVPRPGYHGHPDDATPATRRASGALRPHGRHGWANHWRRSS